MAENITNKVLQQIERYPKIGTPIPESSTPMEV